METPTCSMVFQRVKKLFFILTRWESKKSAEFVEMIPIAYVIR